LYGGTGNDRLFGEAGNDTYIFRRGSGQDIIIDPDPTADNADTIWLGSNLTPEEIVLRRSGNNLILKIQGTTDTLTVQDYFRNDSPLNRIEQIQFMDGTLWTHDDILVEIVKPSEGDDVIYGGPGDDSIDALGGNDAVYGRDGDDTLIGGTGSDRLYGEAGNDTLLGGDGTDTLVSGASNDILDGGADNDTLDGGEGNDTYPFSRGSGQDTIIETDTTAGNVDTIVLGEGVLPQDVNLQRIGNVLKLTIPDSGDAVNVQSWLQYDTPRCGVEQIRFSDGTIWDADTIMDILVTGTEANDIIYSFSRADAIEGRGGDDRLYARGGDDTLDGGSGRDMLYGQAGNDTLQGGEGNDTLVGGMGNDTLDGGAGNDILDGGPGTIPWWQVNRLLMSKSQIFSLTGSYGCV